MIQTLIARWQAKTPAFWKGVQRAALGLSGAALSALGLEQAVAFLPAWASTALGYMATAGTLVGTFIQFMRETPKE